MDPKALAIYLIIERLILEGPQIINEISAAWQKEDPTAEDFQVLADLVDVLRPKDPLAA